MQTRLRGQYNGKWPVSFVCVSRPLVTIITAILFQKLRTCHTASTQTIWNFPSLLYKITLLKISHAYIVFFFLIKCWHDRNKTESFWCPWRDISKNTESLKLQIKNICFWNKQNKSKRDKENLIRRHEIMDSFVCLANAHALMPLVLCQYSPASTAWNTERHK